VKLSGCCIGRNRGVGIVVVAVAVAVETDCAEYGTEVAEAAKAEDVEFHDVDVKATGRCAVVLCDGLLRVAVCPPKCLPE